MKRKVVKKRVFQKPEKDDAKSKAQKKQSDARSPKKDELQKTDKFRIPGLRRSYFAIAVLVLGMMAAGAILNEDVSESPVGNVIENADSISESADYFLANGNYSESLKYYPKAVGLAPNNSRIRYNYAIALSRLNMSDEAILQYRRALEINESYVMAMNNLGVLYQKQGMLNESRQQFEMALYYEPNNTVALLNYANLLAETGVNGEAEAIYKKVISIDPENRDAYRNYAQFLYNKGRYIEAKNMLEKS